MRFVYTGPASGVTLADGTEVLLWPGQSVELPESDYTAALQAQGYLQPVASVQPVASEPGETAQEPTARKRKEA